MHSRHTDLAWAAGFYDGEGSVSVTGSTLQYKEGRTSICISVGQVNREPLDKLTDIFGIGEIYGPYARGGTSQPIYLYKVYGYVNVQYVIAQMWSYISSAKKAQVRKAFTQFDFNRRKPRIAHCVVDKHDIKITPRGYRKCRTCRNTKERNKRAESRITV